MQRSRPSLSSAPFANPRFLLHPASNCSCQALPVGSPALEAGCALFEEGGDSLAIILGKAEPPHRSGLALELLVETVLPARPDHLLDRGEPERRQGGKLAGDSVDLRIERVVVDGLPDHAPLRGFL